ncbi:hypothetical protein DUI87_00126 [Hirundo rustica rustica]|uniref:E3 ubiquitin-protein ligase n=1 Tax=Hirundo rustica rustica TaxID=333673 RepID=A0A3M0LBT3_HIRRU|nr:hypothetical protein DUI87_00126 [Hirundo rustica rustica]
MSGCGGAAKSRVTVAQARVWEFVTRERSARLALLAQEGRACGSWWTARPPSSTCCSSAPRPGPPRRRGALPGPQGAQGAAQGDREGAEEARPAARREREGSRERGRSRPPRGAGAARTRSRQRGSAPSAWARCAGRATLERCRHSFCGECIARALQVRSALPRLRPLLRAAGGQPAPDGAHAGDPRRRAAAARLYEAFGTIIIQYVFPPGVQGVEHPNPGVRYPGTTRVAYMPDCPEGNKVLGLFRKAFAQRLTFTVGTSLTTGRAKRHHMERHPPQDQLHRRAPAHRQQQQQHQQHHQHQQSSAPSPAPASPIIIIITIITITITIIITIITITITIITITITITIIIITITITIIPIPIPIPFLSRFPELNPEFLTCDHSARACARCVNKLGAAGASCPCQEPPGDHTWAVPGVLCQVTTSGQFQVTTPGQFQVTTPGQFQVTTSGQFQVTTSGAVPGDHTWAVPGDHIWAVPGVPGAR